MFFQDCIPDGEILTGGSVLNRILIIRAGLVCIHRYADRLFGLFEVATY
jgi:hypothetical protein